MTSLVPSRSFVDTSEQDDLHAQPVRPAPTARALDRIAHLAALATGATIAQINLLTEDRRIPVAVHIDPTRTPSADITALDESDERVRAFAAARLRTPAGVVLGTVCVANFEPRLWTPAEREALAECAALAGEELASQMSVVTAERSRADAERAHADAETASRAQSEFLDALSRELRGQLDALGTYVELLENGVRESQPTARQDELRRLQLGQRHLLTLVDDVLNYSSLEHGTVSFTLDQIVVRDALVEAEALVAPQVRAKALFLSLGNCREDLAVTADVEKLREILAKLLSNAVRFTGPGGRIDVTCDASRSDVRIRIHDSGVGIPPDKLSVIFEPFVQLRADPDHAVAHAGLGLAISRALARSLGGDVTAESAVGAGSIFTLTLPRAKRLD